MAVVAPVAVDGPVVVAAPVMAPEADDATQDALVTLRQAVRALLTLHRDGCTVGETREALRELAQLTGFELEPVS